MVGTPAARHCQGMSRDPTRSAHGGTTDVNWTEPPRAEADKRGSGRGLPDPQLIVAGLALLAALVLVILAF